MKVPTYTARANTPATTGVREIPLSMAGPAAGQGAMEGIFALSDQISAVSQKIQNREDGIKRAREFNNYFSEVSEEYTRIQNDEDISDGKTLENFNMFLRDKQAEYLSQHTGSAASRAQFEKRLMDQSSKFGIQAIEATNQAQRAQLDEAWDTAAKDIALRVSLGEITLEEAQGEIYGLDDEFGAGYGDDNSMRRRDKIEATQGLMLVTVAQKHLDRGDTDAVKALINTNPDAFVDTLTEKQISDITRQIHLQDSERARIAQEKAAFRESNLAALGKAPGDPLTKEEAYFVNRGEWMPKPDMPDLTSEQKNYATLQRIGAEKGQDSPEYKSFAEMIGVSSTHRMGGNYEADAATDAAKHAAGVDPFGEDRKAFVEAKIAEEPRYLDRLDQEANYGEGIEAVSSAKTAAMVSMRNIEDALLHAANLHTTNPLERAANVQEAIKQLQSGDIEVWGGWSGDIARGVAPGSETSMFAAALEPIRSNVVLEAMNRARAMSKTGSTGFGALSEKEMAILANAEGSLDVNTPQAAVNTLLQMHAAIPVLMSDLRNGFAVEFDLIPTAGEAAERIFGADRPVGMTTTPAAVSGGVMTIGLDGFAPTAPVAAPQPSGGGAPGNAEAGPVRVEDIASQPTEQPTMQPQNSEGGSFEIKLPSIKIGGDDG